MQSRHHHTAYFVLSSLLDCWFVSTEAGSRPATLVAQAPSNEALVEHEERGSPTRDCEYYMLQI